MVVLVVAVQVGRQDDTRAILSNALGIIIGVGYQHR